MGVRSVIDAEGANRVLKILEADETEMSQNWSKRYRENLDKMKTGDIFEVADVVRNLSFKQKEKGTLSTGEKKMLNNAKVILVSELSLAENSSHDEIEKLVDNKIEMSYKEYRVPTEAKIDLQQNAVNKFIPFNGDTNTTNT
jgi:CarD family transcriptional regulator